MVSRPMDLSNLSKVFSEVSSSRACVFLGREMTEYAWMLTKKPVTEWKLFHSKRALATLSIFESILMRLSISGKPMMSSRSTRRCLHSWSSASLRRTVAEVGLVENAAFPSWPGLMEVSMLNVTSVISLSIPM